VVSTLGLALNDRDNAGHASHAGDAAST
jgi:hypothetical protein